MVQRVELWTSDRKSIWRPFTKALNDYQLIQEGDRIAVCISGGKDSMLLAKLIQELKKHGKISFEAVFLVMNPGYNADNWKIIQDNAKLLGIPLTVFQSDIFDTVAGIERNPCYLCARMRRGNLYAKAKELGCNKIALGHHFDDVIETILMGMLYSGMELIAQFRNTSSVIETNIFNSVKNINLRTVIGYHKDDMAYQFLDDYDDR